MATIKQVIPLDSSSLSGVNFTPTEAGWLGGLKISAVGTVYASACVTANASKNITGLNNLTANGTNGVITAKSFTDSTATLTGGTLSGVTLASGTKLTAADLDSSVSGTAILTTLTSTANRLASATAIVTYVGNAISTISYNNMTLTGQTIISNSVKFNTISSGTATNVDWSLHNRAQRTYTTTGTKNITFTSPGGPSNLILELVYQNTVTGVTLPSIRWLDGTTPTLDGVNGDFKIITLYYNGSVYYGSAGAFG